MGHTKKVQKLSTKEKLRLRKKESKKNKHRARLMLRNLPFAATEENVQKHFEQFGEVDEVKLLKKEDGQLLGCGFVQFKLVQKAAKARHHLNGKPFFNREIEVDWAVPKNKFDKQREKNQVEPVTVKEEPTDEGYEAVIKTEVDEIKEEPCGEQNNEIKNNEVKDNSVMVQSSEEEDNDVESESDEDSGKEEGKSEDEDDHKPGFEDDMSEKKPHVVSNDATEGRTVFIKNVPFSATNEDVKECLSQFGPLYYALVCMDRLTEHSKGTAFVKFRNKEDADSCLATPEIKLLGNTLECQCALTKDDLQRKTSEKKDRGPKDSRNLYLVKEGVVLAGSKAAEGVSAADMAKRLQIEQYKTQMLKNLNMFVARTRLIVHNIPENWDDSKLRKLFMKYSGPKATIKEAKIMRNMRLVDGRGVGKSKEFGFVTFTTHEAALQALRSVNNNPNVFSANKRPIVAFSIENRARLQARERRLMNSQLKNPKSKNYDPSRVKVKEHEENKGTKRPLENSSEELKEFSGVAATPGIKKMRSKFNLKTQARLHHEYLKKEKKSKKHAKKTLKEKQQEFTKQPRQKINKNKTKTGDNFSKLVNDYKQKLLSGPKPIKKTKWYE